MVPEMPADGPNQSLTTFTVSKASSAWYPVMLSHACGEISEGRACEILSTDRFTYRRVRDEALSAVRALSVSLVEPTRIMVDALTAKDGTGNPGEHFGFCPECGKPGVSRQLTENGKDTCDAGHVYPSREAGPPWESIE